MQQTAMWYFHPPTGLKQHTRVDKVLETFTTSAIFLVSSSWGWLWAGLGEKWEYESAGGEGSSWGV